MHAYRTHHCDLGMTGEPDIHFAVPEHLLNADVKVAGWCHRIRDHGGLLFIDLRDHYGIVQVTVDPAKLPIVETLRSEFVVSISGTIKWRPTGTENTRIPTGLVEIVASQIEVLGPVYGELPIPVFGEVEYPEEQRLKYRFLDLRREKLHDNIVKRSRIIRWLRGAMEDRGFMEFQTPILTASSPEGARDFLVPSRVHPGKFYALPQAPQQFKQLTMMSGFDRYFQIAPCFRDEGARADRSPGEFYQLDIEMAFVTQEDVFQTVEPVLRDLFRTFGGGKPVTEVFPRIPYNEAMVKYGSDKPDLRNPIEIANVSEIFRNPGMTLQPFIDAMHKGAVVRAIPAPGAASRPRKFFSTMEDSAKEQGAGGLAYIAFSEEGPKGPMVKFLTEDLQKRLQDEAKVGQGDALFFVVDTPPKASRIAGIVRDGLGDILGLTDKNKWAFCWIVDFPMFEWNEEEKRIDFSHNPFSMPQGGMEALETKDPLDISAYQYDIVCNGVELSSGAIRNHRPDIMERAFGLAGYDREVLEAKFGGMLNALRLGAPPHGGIAPGIDRMVMLLCEEPNLREVVLFPMNQRGEDLMMGAPAEVTKEQLAELSIRTVPVAK